MRNFQERKRHVRRLRSMLIAIILVVVIIFLSRSVFSLYKKNKITRETLGQSNGELDSLEERKFALEKELENLSTDRGVESVVRGKFNVAKEGERVITIIEDDTATSTDDLDAEGSFWKSLFFWRN